METALNPSAGGFWDMTSRYAFGKEERFPKGRISVVSLARKSFTDPVPGGLRTTWLGHSTVLIDVDGHRVLTDPVRRRRASPTQWFGPRRFHAPPLALEDLPPLDAVVISHDHCDHLVEAADGVGVSVATPRPGEQVTGTAPGVVVRWWDDVHGDRPVLAAGRGPSVQPVL